MAILSHFLRHHLHIDVYTLLESFDISPIFWNQNLQAKSHALPSEGKVTLYLWIIQIKSSRLQHENGLKNAIKSEK